MALIRWSGNQKVANYPLTALFLLHTGGTMIELETATFLYFLVAAYLLGAATVLGAFSLFSGRGHEQDEKDAGCLLRLTAYLCLATAAILVFSGVYG
jgi:cytochrome c biogenesis protein CcdA